MILGLRSRKEKVVEEVKEDAPMKNLVSKMHCKRLNLWRALEKQAPERPTFSIIESDVEVKKN